MFSRCKSEKRLSSSGRGGAGPALVALERNRVQKKPQKPGVFGFYNNLADVSNKFQSSSTKAWSVASSLSFEWESSC